MEEYLEMAVLDILTLPSKVLKEKALSVGVVDDSVRVLLDDMLETMYSANGIGLAANQVGVLLRVVVMDIADGAGSGAGSGDSVVLEMVNPEIVEHSLDKSEYEEGCLSVPGYYAKVERPVSVRVRYLDRFGVECFLDADGLLATCIQHEIDHLDGIVFIDRISALKRRMALRKVVKSSRLTAVL